MRTFQATICFWLELPQDLLETSNFTLKTEINRPTIVPRCTIDEVGSTLFIAFLGRRRKREKVEGCRRSLETFHYLAKWNNRTNRFVAKCTKYWKIKVMKSYQIVVRSAFLILISDIWILCLYAISILHNLQYLSKKYSCATNTREVVTTW